MKKRIKFSSPKGTNVLISVVIPTYRDPHLLLRCLKALNEQTLNCENFEVVVVSDGPDTSAEKNMQSSMPNCALQIRYFSLPEKKGPAAARNMGWLQSKGTLIAFTDDDCIPYKDWLQNIVNEYKNEQEVAYTGKVIVQLPENPSDLERNMAAQENVGFLTANCICTKKALIKIGGFDERFEMAWREDSDFEFKLIEDQVPIKYLVNAVVIHPVRQTSWSVSLKEKRKGMFNALLYKKFPDLYRSKIQSEPFWQYYFLILFFLGFFIGLYLRSEITIVTCLFCWLFLLVPFVKKRLKDTSHSFKHMIEMLIISIIIPFASVYWHWYGAFKYRVLFF